MRPLPNSPSHFSIDQKTPEAAGSTTHRRRRHSPRTDRRGGFVDHRHAGHSEPVALRDRGPHGHEPWATDLLLQSEGRHPAGGVRPDGAADARAVRVGRQPVPAWRRARTRGARCRVSWRSSSTGRRRRTLSSSCTSCSTRSWPRSGTATTSASAWRRCTASGGPTWRRPVATDAAAGDRSATLASLVQAMVHGLVMQLEADPNAFDRTAMLDLCLRASDIHDRQPQPWEVHRTIPPAPALGGPS